MKKLFLVLILHSIIFSCNKENIKSDFIGNWTSTSDTNVDIDIQFYKDSIIVDSWSYNGTYSTKWKVKNLKIVQTLQRGDKSILKQKNKIDYKFNLTKDTLYLKSETDSIFQIKLVKINNGYEYFENKIGFKIKLIKSNKKLTSIEKNEYGFNVYVGYKNKKLIAKTDYSENLNKLAAESINFTNTFLKTEEKHLKYVLFIDKNVSNKKIDSIKSYLKKEIINNVFVVRGYKEKRWNEPINWLGVYEKIH